MRHAGGDGRHGRVPSVLAACTVVAPDRQRLTGSLTQPGAAGSVHSQAVGAAVGCSGAPAVGGPMVITWKEGKPQV